MSIYEKNNVNITGEGEKYLILANGFGTDQSIWRYIKEAFKDSYKIVQYDNTGEGKSDVSFYSPYKYSNLESYANDLIEICDELNIKNANVMAHSVSAMITIIASIKRPELFDKVIFIGASPRYLNDKDYIGGFEQKDLNELFAAMENNYYAWTSGFAPVAMNNPERPELGEEFASTLRNIRPDIAIAVSKTIFQSDNRQKLQFMKKPTLIIQASEDVAVPVQVGKYINEHISDSKLVNIPATGHFPHISAPDQIIKLAKEFF